MGKLIKNHWARLLTLTAATYHLLAAIESFFWPKILWDWSTKLLDPAVKPIPILQTINLVAAVIVVAWEWPMPWISGTVFHKSIETRLIMLPLISLAAVLLYQGTNAALYYMIAEVVWFAAFAVGEEVCPVPWTVPKRGKPEKLILYRFDHGRHARLSPRNEDFNPKDKFYSIFKKAMETDHPAWQWSSGQSELTRAFMKWIADQARPLEISSAIVAVPALCHGSTIETSLFVDLGGSIGDQFVALKQAFLQIPGRDLQNSSGDERHVLAGTLMGCNCAR